MSEPTAPPASEAFDIPNPFGRYEILKRLGQGGRGAVYLAEDTHRSARRAG
jgi:hypothetical protein